MVSLFSWQTATKLSGKNSIANVIGGSRKLVLRGSVFWVWVSFTMAQCCIHTTEAHVNMQLAAAAAMAFGSVAFSGVVVGGGGSRVRSEMGLQAVLSPAAVCPSFAIRLGDALSICWGFGCRAVSYSLACHSRRNCYLCLAHHDCDLLSCGSSCLCASGLEPGCRQRIPSWARRATLSPVTPVWQRISTPPVLQLAVAITGPLGLCCLCYIW